MSKFVDRIMKNKKMASKTLDDIESIRENGNSTLPRSKTTNLNVANGRSMQSPLSPNGDHKNSDRNHFSDSSGVSSSPGDPQLIGVCHSPVEIPAEVALLLIAEDPPHVARSTPKGLAIDTSKWKEENDMKHCIYDRQVYEKMIANSLKTCELLQTNLDSYITVVRQAHSRGVTPVKAGDKESHKGRVAKDHRLESH